MSKGDFLRALRAVKTGYLDLTTREAEEFWEELCYEATFEDLNELLEETNA